MTFHKLHCALTVAACAGIVICAAALSHAAEFKMSELKMSELKAPELKMNEFKMSEFKMQPYKVSADLGLDNLRLNDLDYFGLGLDGKKISAAKKKSGSGRKTSKKSKVSAGVKK